MSILRSLIRLVDPLGHRQFQEELRRKREALPADPFETDEHVVLDPGPAPAEAERYRCRICAHEQAGPGFCPTCLADTLQPLR